MNLLTYPHTLLTLFKLSWQLYRSYLLGMLVLTAVLLSPSMLFGLAGWFETESVVFFLSMRVLESAMAMGVLGIAYGSVFPAAGVIRSLRANVLLGAVHVAILQYLLFFVGVIGLTVLPFPFSVLMVVFWLAGLFLFSLAQPVFVLENHRGIQAMVRSFQLVRIHFARVFLVVVLSMLIQFMLFAMFFRLFLPELELTPAEEIEQLQLQLSAILQDDGVHRAMRFSQYLTALIFFPFSALLTVLLYFNLAHREGGLNLDQCSSLAHRLFGTPLSRTPDSSPSMED